MSRASHDTPRRPYPGLLHWTNTLVCVGAILAATVAAGSQTARAATDGSGSVVGDNIEAEIDWNGGGETHGCRWREATGADPLAGTVRELPLVRTVDGVLERLYVRDCPDSYSLHWIRADTSERMAAAAHARASRLVPALLARTAPPSARMVVNVGTWFWVPRALWRPVSVTATVATPYGPISVTTTARPTTLVYSPGNGEASRSCRGPGEPWKPRFGDRTASSCMYTYRSASHTTALGSFRARMTIVWKVTWRSSLLVGGSLPDIRTGADLRAVVLELQAIAS